MANDDLLSDLKASRQRFLALVADVRPDLHRYCARMTGSLADGEDVVQDTLSRAYFALAELDALPELRPWLFTIAHRRAIDHLRRYERKHGRPLDDLDQEPAADAPAADDALAREEAMRAAIGRFGELPPLQRSSVVLKDVLDHSVDEIAALLGASVPAVKAALHRGRERLKSLPPAAADATAQVSPEVARYAELFNARDWDGVRALLAEDVRLDLVARVQRQGRREVSQYFSNYSSIADWRLVPARLEGRDVLAVYRAKDDARPGYFVELEFAGGRLVNIRDYRYVPYIANDASFAFVPS